MLLIKLLILLLLTNIPCFALHNLGVHGALYPIAESNIVNDVKRQLSSYSYDAQGIAEKGYVVNNYIPDAMREQKKYNVYVFNSPDTVMKEDKVIIYKGQQLNALDSVRLQHKFLFIKAHHLPLYNKLYFEDSSVVLMLIQGDTRPLLAEYPDRTIYIANKNITDYLKIEYVPTLMYQDGNRMVRHEIPYSDTTH